jgi:hypothetical protein
MSDRHAHPTVQTEENNRDYVEYGYNDVQELTREEIEDKLTPYEEVDDVQGSTVFIKGVRDGSPNDLNHLRMRKLRNMGLELRHVYDDYVSFSMTGVEREKYSRTVKRTWV